MRRPDHGHRPQHGDPDHQQPGRRDGARHRTAGLERRHDDVLRHLPDQRGRQHLQQGERNPGQHRRDEDLPPLPASREQPPEPLAEDDPRRRSNGDAVGGRGLRRRRSRQRSGLTGRGEGHVLPEGRRREAFAESAKPTDSNVPPFPRPRRGRNEHRLQQPLRVPRGVAAVEASALGHAAGKTRSALGCGGKKNVRLPKEAVGSGGLCAGVAGPGGSTHAQIAAAKPNDPRADGSQRTDPQTPPRQSALKGRRIKRIEWTHVR